MEIDEGEKKWDKYDISRNNNQKKIIEQLKEEIKVYQERERAFQLHLKMRDIQINSLKKEIDVLMKRDAELISEETTKKQKTIIVDPLLQNEFNKMKELIEERKKSLKEKNTILESTQDYQAKDKKINELIERCRNLTKENKELYEFVEVGVLENLKYENGLAKSQIDQLMVNIKERELLNAELENELNETNQQVNMLSAQIPK